MNKKILVPVESPGKISKIQKILGNDYIVMATYGHFIDLHPQKMSIDIDNNFEPTYVPIKGRGNDVINKLKDAYSKSKDIYIATDNDREGEMIAQSIASTLKLKDPKRIVFTCITEKEIKNAISCPLKINENMVCAQKTRRFLDRIVGFSLSPLLWRHISKSSLSAGRVQSVVVKIIIDREKEIDKFFSKDEVKFYKYSGKFIDSIDNNTHTIEAVLYKDKNKYTSKNDCDMKLIMKFLSESSYKIFSISKKISTSKPSPPFTTSTLQQEAARKLSFSVKRTMMAAQKLYESGHITYMRTDSISLSLEATNAICEFVENEYGKDYMQRRVYKTKSQNTQEAHEAIRPTHVETTTIQSDPDEQKLYKLIWQRSVASQMSSAKYEIYTIDIDIDKLPTHKFVASVEKNLFKGFLRVYTTNEDKSDNAFFVPMCGKQLKVDIITATQDCDKPPPRFNEASLINILDPSNLNIGRPSTYASIISKIQDVGYIEIKDFDGKELFINIVEWNGTNISSSKKKIMVGKEQKKLCSTNMANCVNTYLLENFPQIIDCSFTAQMEQNCDDVASGKKNWQTVLRDFCCVFFPVIEKLSLIKKEDKILGIHPVYNEQISVSTGKYGPLLITKNNGKIIKAPIKLPLTIDNITIDNALEILQYPKILGMHDDKEVYIQKGKYGIYISHNKSSYNVGCILESDLTLDKAIEIINEKNKNVYFKKSEGNINYSVLNGQYGYYINIRKQGSKGKNIPLPKDFDLATVNLGTIKSIAKNYKPKQRFHKKK